MVHAEYVEAPNQIKERIRDDRIRAAAEVFLEANLDKAYCDCSL